MTEQDHQLLSRYIDGELSLIEQRAVEKRLDSEPALQAQLERLQDVQAALGQAFPLAPQDERLAEIASLLEKPASSVVPFPGKRKEAAEPGRRWQFGLAASLAAAIGVVALQGVQTTGLSLAQFLESTPSSGDTWTELEDGSQVRAMLSFQSNDGGWCREYMARGVGKTAGNSLHAVACRENQEWLVKVSTEAGLLGNTELYQPANAADTSSVAAFIEREARDIPLDAVTEQRLIDTDWQ